MFMQAKSSIHTWIWNDAAIKPASAACGIAEPDWPTISQTSQSRLTDCQNNLKVKSAAACSSSPAITSTMSPSERSKQLSRKTYVLQM